MELNGLRVSRETQQRLDHFVALFRKWSAVINLAAPSTLDQLWSRHILDSVQILQLSPASRRWIDLGSGGGFPGVVLAILLADNGEGHIDLVESNQKKAAFLRLCLRECDARGEVHAVRIETAPALLDACDIICARALADLDQLCRYAWPWVERNRNTRLLLHKGRDYRSEVTKARGRWNFDLVEHTSIVEKDSVVLDISRLEAKV